MGLVDWLHDLLTPTGINEVAAALMRTRALYTQAQGRCETDECRAGYQDKIDEIDDALQPYGIDLRDGFTPDDWNEVVEAVPTATLDLITETGEAVIGEIGDLSLQFIRGLGAALVEGAEGAYDVITAKLSGKEPEMVAAITATILVVLVSSFLWHEVKRGPRA